MAAAYCSSLILIACKLQKSILCQETCKNMERNESKQTSSWAAGIANYVTSYFWDKPEETIQSGPDAQTQQLFSNCINFLATDGIKALCDKIEAVSTEVFGNVPLSKEVNVKHLLEKIKSKMENATGCKNFSEYVIPLSRKYKKSERRAFGAVWWSAVEVEILDFRGMPKEPRLIKFASYLSACASEATIYGTCVSDKAAKVNHKDSSKSHSLIEMKIQRQKRASKILTFYRYNYGFQPPHSVLLDGNFCQAALQNKINLREQMPKYFMNEVNIVVTNCILKELEALGKEVGGALAICRQFNVVKCPHNPPRTAADCIRRLARRSKKEERAKYFIGTQDDALLQSLRELGGIPLMSVKYNSILLEKPSRESISGLKTSADDLEKVKLLKREVLGVEEQKPQKRKGPKGPNPLSCKKKKQSNQTGAVAGAFGKQNKGESEDNMTNKEKKKRRRKKINPAYMKILKENVDIAPVTFFATLLNAPCTALLLASESKESVAYLIVGKSNGETVFFPTDRSECVSKIDCAANVPITAIASGDLRNTGKVEVITITSNGLLQSLEFPSVGLSRTFCQQIYANVCSAQILDVDGDGSAELVVVMTDRVVRSYRFIGDAEKLVPLNKWEMPSQISGWSIGIDNSNQCYALLSQYGQSHHVVLEFGATKEVRVVQPRRNDSRLYATQLFVPLTPTFATLFHSLAEKIIVADHDTNCEMEICNPESDFMCVTTMQLDSGLNVLVALDSYGELLIYGWSKDIELRSEPLARCQQVMREVDYMCGFPGPSQNSLMIGLVNVFNKVSLFSIDLSHAVSI
ncbi:fcf1 domain-containing protein [Ditylenchus destructor]|uniref:rRNA-processing protein UTP23 homolog n=1 Tax=Ditylenchus destructor TaxID=166010 RepID=A0AAD4NBF3_9BILA|nr:fcf1 domain-containing protein [Ditylenchus destructor]